MGKSEKPLSRKEDLVVQELNGEVLIYDLRKNKAFCLNETSALVWQACDGNNSISDIGEKIGSEDIVWLALDELKKERLIEDGTSPASKFNGMSRRDVIKKIGIGSVIALPVVASLVAPAAAHAQSCFALGASCTTSSQCCSTCCKNVSPSVNQCKPGGGACLP
jgi:hypothetical protein